MLNDPRRASWLLFALAFLLYARTISFDYALDDRAVTFQNRFVTAGFDGLGSILTTFYWAGFWNTYSGLFRPLSLLLFATEWQLFPNAPHLYHLVNVALYAAASALLYRALRTLLREERPEVALLATAIWIIHPAHTEVVANIKSADEILAVLFLALMLQSALQWIETRSIWRLAATGAAFLLALLSKEGAVLFGPAVLLAALMFRRPGAALLIRLGALYAAVAASWLAWHDAVIRGGPARALYRYVDNSLVAAPDLGSRIATALQMQGRYLVKVITGYPLSYDYSFNQIPNISPLSVSAAVSALTCLGLVVFAAVQSRRQQALAFGILFYFGTFALTSNVFILIGATMADRFLFVPSIGFAVALGWLAVRFRANPAVIWCTGALIVLFTAHTLVRSGDWKSDATLFEADVAHATRSGRVHRNYGTLLMNSSFETQDPVRRREMLEVAFGQFSRAVSIDARDYDAQFALGQIEFQRGHYPQSAAWSARSIETYRALGGTTPDLTAYLNLGDALMMSGQLSRAVAAFESAAKADPRDARPPLRLGSALVAAGDLPSAQAWLEKAVALDPSSDQAWDKLANVAGMRGNYARSNEAFLMLTKLRPSDPHPYQMLATNYERLGDDANARKYQDAFRARMTPR